MDNGQDSVLDKWYNTEGKQLSLDIHDQNLDPDSDREYLSTHPWLTFKANLKYAPPRLWMLLGEARAKCESLGRVPIAPAYAQELHTIYLAKGIHGTTAIEGNTLSEEQVRKIISGDLKLPPSQDYLKKEVENILSACNALSQRAMNGRPPELSSGLIRAFNKAVLDGLELEEHVMPGEIRNYSVGVLRYRGAPHQDCRFLLDKLCIWLNSMRKESRSPEEEILRAILAHLYLAWIHPFGDGNGRTARLMEFQILINGGIPMPAAHAMSNYYNMTRNRYLQELDAASKSGGDITSFLTYAVEGFVEQLSEQLALVAGQQLDLAWRDFVHEQFSTLKDTASNHRRRDLLLSLSWVEEPVPRSGIRTLNPSLERAYRDKTDKTVTRDINWLLDKGFIRESDGGLTANSEIILGFVPPRRERKLAESVRRQEKVMQGLKRRLQAQRRTNLPDSQSEAD